MSLTYGLKKTVVTANGNGTEFRLENAWKRIASVLVSRPYNRVRFKSKSQLVFARRAVPHRTMRRPIPIGTSRSRRFRKIDSSQWKHVRKNRFKPFSDRSELNRVWRMWHEFENRLVTGTTVHYRLIYKRRWAATHKAILYFRPYNKVVFVHQNTSRYGGTTVVANRK